jgi:hypothetical protein
MDEQVLGWLMPEAYKAEASVEEVATVKEIREN